MKITNVLLIVIPIGMYKVVARLSSWCSAHLFSKVEIYFIIGLMFFSLRVVYLMCVLQF